MIKCSAILFERDDLLYVFHAALASADRHLLQRVALTAGTSGRFTTNVLDNQTTWLTPPLYLNVDMESGATSAHWIDSMSAAMPAVLVMAGDPVGAARVNALYERIWREWGALPERWNWKERSPQLGMSCVLRCLSCPCGP